MWKCSKSVNVKKQNIIFISPIINGKIIKNLKKCINVEMYQCKNVEMYTWKNVSSYKCICLQMYTYTNVDAQM